MRIDLDKPDLPCVMSVLGPAAGPYTPETVIDALKLFRAGRSAEMVQRATGVPKTRVTKWVELLALRRTRDEVLAIQRAALDAARAIRPSSKKR